MLNREESAYVARKRIDSVWGENKQEVVSFVGRVVPLVGRG